MKRICVFGASISSGYNDFENGGRCDQLKKKFIKEGIFIFNLSISGDNTTRLLGRVGPECVARKPDAIIIALGGNDSHFFFEKKKHRIPLNQTKKNLQNIIEIAREFTENIIVIGLTRVDEPKINQQLKNKKIIYKNEYLQTYDAAIKNIAQKNNLQFIPTFDIIKQQDLDDGLHPNSKGHVKILQRIQEYISSRDF